MVSTRTANIVTIIIFLFFTAHFFFCPPSGVFVEINTAQRVHLARFMRHLRGLSLLWCESKQSISHKTYLKLPGSSVALIGGCLI